MRHILFGVLFALPAFGLEIECGSHAYLLRLDGYNAKSGKLEFTVDGDVATERRIPVAMSLDSLDIRVHFLDEMGGGLWLRQPTPGSWEGTLQQSRDDSPLLLPCRVR